MKPIESLIWVSTLSVAASCARAPEPTIQTPPPASAPRVVYIIATPTVLPSTADFTLIPTAPPTATFQSGEQTFSLAPAVAPPPVEVAPFPNMDPVKTPTPRSLEEQLRTCLTYTASVEHMTSTHILETNGRTGGEQVIVQVFNRCSVSFPSEDSWFQA